jgi:hypothetical protein
MDILMTPGADGGHPRELLLRQTQSARFVMAGSAGLALMGALQQVTRFRMIE